MPRLIIVCTANVCRSPLAEVLLRDWAQRKNLTGNWDISSAGTWAHSGMRPPSAAIEALTQYKPALGEILKLHRSRQLTALLVANADMVLCMTAYHQEALAARYASHADRIQLLTELGGPPYDVPDMMGGVADDYRRLIKELVAIIETAGDEIATHARHNELYRAN